MFNSLDVNPLTDLNLSADPSKFEVLDFFGLREGDKLSLDQGEIIMDLRLEQINFVKSSSMPNSPCDGNCLISCIVDQVNHDHIMSGFIDNENSFIHSLSPENCSLWIQYDEDWKTCS